MLPYVFPEMLEKASRTSSTVSGEGGPSKIPCLTPSFMAPCRDSVKYQGTICCGLVLANLFFEEESNKLIPDHFLDELHGVLKFEVEQRALGLKEFAAHMAALNEQL